MKEASLLTGRLEPTNEAYAVAKIAGIKLCQAYRSQYGSNFIVGIPATRVNDDYYIVEDKGNGMLKQKEKHFKGALL